MRFKPPEPPLNPKETLSNYVRESHRTNGVTLETATLFTLIGMLAASGVWILNSQVSLEKRLTTLETQYQSSQESLKEIKEKIAKLSEKIDLFIIENQK
jgi:hypothetical protein